MNENISPDLEKNEPDQPLSFKNTRLVEKNSRHSTGLRKLMERALKRL